MNERENKVQSINSDLYEEMMEIYNMIIEGKSVLDFIKAVDYEVIENERNSVLNMTISEFLKDWANDGLF